MNYFYIDKHTEFKLYKRIEEQLNWKNGIPRNISELKNYCYYGYSNAELRPKYWKLFLNYLPDNKFKTEHFLKDRRKSYDFYIQRIKNSCNVIEDDVNRTLLIAENESSSTVCNDILDLEPNVEKHKRCAFLDSNIFNSAETHRDAIKRILLTYKATNVTIGYVQGMNMLLIPIYYVFVNSSDLEDVAFAEADSFFCFLNLMCEIGDCFVPGLDFDQQLGIKRKLEAVIKIVEKYDKELFIHLHNNNIFQTPFHLRWVTILLAHEFSIDKTILLWDRLLADINRFEMVQYCSAAILIINRKEILSCEHDGIMEIIQNFEIDDVLSLFYLGDEIRRDIRNKE